jgi:hypothetical protein
LADINTDIGTLAGKYILLNDIPLDDSKAGVDAAYGWIPIGDSTNIFTGIFNGNGNTITNLWINRTSADYVGLFGFIQNAKIKNLTVETAEGKEVKGRYFVGAIAGYVSGSSITNSHSTGNVSGVDSVGGIAGYVGGSSITNSYATGNVSGDNMVGGIAGVVELSSSVTNSYSAGNVSGDYYIGGIAGRVEFSSSISNSYSTGNVNGVGYVGGIAGSVEFSSSVTNSYAAGTISGITNQVGGIAGFVYDNSIVTNSYSTGNVSGNERVGGIAGDVASSNIVNSAAINPSVIGVSHVNRIAGSIDVGSIATNNFALESMTDGTKTLNEGGFTNGSGDNAGTSKTEVELKTQSTYSDTVIGDGAGGLGWLFGEDDNSPWKIDENESYPYLYWE